MISMIVVSKYCLADFFRQRGTPPWQKVLFLDRNSSFFAAKYFGAEGTPFLDPVIGGGGLGGESIELFRHLIREPFKNVLADFVGQSFSQKTLNGKGGFPPPP